MFDEFLPQAVAKVITGFESEMAGLAVFNEEERGKREMILRADYGSRLNEAIQAETTAADAEISHLQTEIDRLNGADPVTTLNEAELQTANLRDRFVSQDFETLPLSALAARLKAGLAAGDRALLFLYARAGQSRLRTENTTAPTHRPPRLKEFADLVERAARLFDTSDPARVKELKSQIDAQQRRKVAAQSAKRKLQPATPAPAIGRL